PTATTSPYVGRVIHARVPSGVNATCSAPSSASEVIVGIATSRRTAATWSEPLAIAALPSGVSATSAGEKPSAIGVPEGLGADWGAGGSTVNEKLLLTCGPGRTTWMVPVTAFSGTRTTIEVLVTSVPSTESGAPDDVNSTLFIAPGAGSKPCPERVTSAPTGAWRGRTSLIATLGAGAVVKIVEAV